LTCHTSGLDLLLGCGVGAYKTNSEFNPKSPFFNRKLQMRDEDRSAHLRQF
jgi:hypothetical protein